MRLSREIVALREGFVLEALKANSQLTGEQLQVMLQEKFGKRMRIGRLYELKKQTVAPVPTAVGVEGPEQEPGVAP